MASVMEGEPTRSIWLALMTLMPAGTLSTGSSLPPVGAIGTSAAPAQAGAAGGVGASTRGDGGAGAALAGGGRETFCFGGATTSIFGRTGGLSAGAAVDGGVVSFFFGATTSSLGSGGVVGGAALAGGDGSWLSLGPCVCAKAKSAKARPPAITAMLRMEIRMSLPEAQFSMTRASDFLFLVVS